MEIRKITSGVSFTLQPEDLEDLDAYLPPKK